KIRKPKKLPPIAAGEVPFGAPEGWEWVRFNRLITFGPRNGYSPKPVEHPTSVKSLTLAATTSGVFVSSHFKYVDVQVDDDSHLWLEDGDLLIQRGNTIDYVGIAAAYRGADKAFIYPDLMMKVRVSGFVSTEF